MDPSPQCEISNLQNYLVYNFCKISLSRVQSLSVAQCFLTFLSFLIRIVPFQTTFSLKRLKNTNFIWIQVLSVKFLISRTAQCTLTYSIAGHARLFISESFSTLDTLIRATPFTKFSKIFFSPRLLQPIDFGEKSILPVYEDT